MDSMDDLDELTTLIDCVETQETDQSLDKHVVKTTNTFNPLPSPSSATRPGKTVEQSEVHDGNTDSSEDEDNKYVDCKKYSESGRHIKQLLDKSATSTSINFGFNNTTWKSTKKAVDENHKRATSVTDISKDVYSDPFFGIRIITPLISSQTLKQKMEGKLSVSFSKMEKHLQIYDKSSDWVMAGVIVSKFCKTSNKGNQYACWTLSDLREGLKTVSVFLFGSAYKNLWKTSTHVVVGILNATPLENKKSSNDVAALSVMNSDQVMIWGQSKDLGVCKARKKNGEPCKAFVNLNQCEFCIYHVKQEYQKFTGRSELQASWGGRHVDLKNKVLGKNEVFYAGKSFTAVRAKPSKKQVMKDKSRLSQLFNKCESRLGPESPSTPKPHHHSSSRVQLMKDAERLQKLTGSPASINSLKQGTDDQNKQKLTNVPKLTKVSTFPHAIKNEHCDRKGYTNLSQEKKTTAVKPKPATEDHQTKVAHHHAVPKKRLAVSSGTTDKHPINGRKPTKSRFDNLTKMNSSSNKQSPATKLIDMFDVSFEFDDEWGKSRSLSKEGMGSTLHFKRTTNENKTPQFVLEKPRVNSIVSSASIGTEDMSVCDLNLKSSTSSFEEGNLPTKPLILKAKLDNFSLTNRSYSVNEDLNSSQRLSVGSPSQPLEEKKPHSRFECNSYRNNTMNLKMSPEEKSEGKQKSEKPGLDGHSVEKAESSPVRNIPRLSKFTGPMTVRLSGYNKAKANALKYVKAHGPFEKEDLKTKKSPNNQGKKRKYQCEESDNSGGQQTVMSKHFVELMETTSKHLELISKAEFEAMDEYYEKMEKKEKMEEKMLSIFKIDCKAFRCLKCKYKWFSPSEICKSENHPIKVISATKRFFECHNCKNRTVSLEIIPLRNCSKCGTGNWKPTSMMRERKPATVKLSIRGGERKFTNSVETDINLDLLVPDA